MLLSYNFLRYLSAVDFVWLVGEVDALSGALSLI